jgi:hypothetical protein
VTTSGRVIKAAVGGAMMLGFLVGLSGPAMAGLLDGAPLWGDAKSPDGEFAQGLAEFARQIHRLDEITESSTSRLRDIAGYSAQDAKNEAEKYRRLMIDLSQRLAPDGELTEQANKALTWVNANLDRIQRDHGLEDEFRTYLLAEWTRHRDEVQKGIGELRAAGEKLSLLLREMSGYQRYLEEMVLLQKAKEAADIIRKLVDQIRGTTTVIERQIKELHLRPTS